jgi:predicted component of viral defense system (DUF524 family)
MTDLSEATLELQGTDGPLLMRIFPTTGRAAGMPAPLRVVDRTTASEEGTETIQILEGIEYSYEIDGLPNSLAITSDTRELLIPDRVGDGRKGHLRPGNRVGLLPIQLQSGNRTIGHAALEVRSRKFDYISHFRWMLRDIATQSIAALMQRFAPTHVRLESDTSRDPVSAYQTFRLIRSIIEDPLVTGAIHTVINRPHTEWLNETEQFPASRGLANPGAAKVLFASGPRVPWPRSPYPGLETLPSKLPHSLAVETVDTVPNRFVKHVLERWSLISQDLRTMVELLKDGPLRQRALGEIDSVLAQLGHHLEAPMFKEIARLRDMPTSNQVLLKRSGYREILVAYAMVEAGVALRSTAIPGLSAGQKDIPKLYEYWVFLQLVEALRSVCDELDELPSIDEEFRGGHRNCLSGKATRYGRPIEVTLCYNRGFGPPNESWTSAMRPDISLRIALESGMRNVEDLWIHFDAKYRVDKLSEVFVDESEESSDSVLREDILKMHAYKDSIRSSGGAYVVFPGSGESAPDAVRKEYEELLPGVGAFRLVPSESGTPIGSEAIRSHLNNVLEHYASTATMDRRTRYWTNKAHQGPVPLPTGRGSSNIRPPADIQVLLGYVQKKQLDWIQRTGYYNLRAGTRKGAVAIDGPELSCELVVMWGNAVGVKIRRVIGGPEVWSRVRMTATGYHEPKEEAYFGIPLGEEVDFPDLDLLTVKHLAFDRARDEYGPAVVSLLDLFELAGEKS